jgi:hypothetical protein
MRLRQRFNTTDDSARGGATNPSDQLSREAADLGQPVPAAAVQATIHDSDSAAASEDETGLDWYDLEEQYLGLSHQHTVHPGGNPAASSNYNPHAVVHSTPSCIPPPIWSLPSGGTFSC